MGCRNLHQDYFYIVDGNKNIRSMVDTSGTEVANYDYNPFGSVSTDGQLTAIGRENPFRFSSEYHDDETGLIYYNYRYYNPELGRWTKRDPIEEKGGYNLYGMVRNNAVNKWDYNGMKWNITRDRKRYADACSDSSRDTFEKLATQLFLNEEEYKIWANTTDEKPRIGKVYKIPNLMILQLSPSKFKERNDLLDIIHILRQGAYQQLRFFDSQGYKTIFQENASGPSIKAAMGLNGLYIYTYAGHSRGINLASVTPGMYTKYGIALMSLLACNTADYNFGISMANKIPNRKVKYNLWELNVSRAGLFIGFQGSVHAFDIKSKMRKVHGARGQ